ncbi:ATP-dependent DNA helicase [Salmonella enterica subsp. arizonae]|uniref:ATP-dependent DNA helicase n=1 Tax=Salmonella enterica subsp. arizonae TaxID=59203 RepID=A0A447QWC7_SALER|nr:ATP-dependent DNA helicase [Salmonella enterica subsp. arizonae]
MSGRLLDAVPLNSLTGVGAAQSSKLAKIGLHTVQDLLLHLPLRYEDRTISTRLANCCLASTPPLKVKC